MRKRENEPDEVTATYTGIQNETPLIPSANGSGMRSFNPRTGWMEEELDSAIPDPETWIDLN